MRSQLLEIFLGFLVGPFVVTWLVGVYRHYLSPSFRLDPAQVDNSDAHLSRRPQRRLGVLAATGEPSEDVVVVEPTEVVGPLPPTLG